MKILVTGATGFIGSHLCKKLVSKGYDVVGLSRSGNSFRVDSLKKNFILRVGDIRNMDFVSSLFKSYKFDTVFHLAGQVPYSPDDKDMAGINVDGTIHVLKASKQYRVERFIYASSMSVYSTPPSYLPVDEIHPTIPTDMYGITKYAGELACKHSLLDMSIVRFAGVYGKHSDDKRAVSVFVRNALRNEPIFIKSDGTQSSDFVYINDVVQGLILAWQKGGNTAYNIGSGEETRVIDLANLIIKLTKSKSRLNVNNSVTDRPFRFYVDISKAKNELGYKPVPLIEGLNAFIKNIS